jgi:aryl-alcohol dehydrogenase
MTSTAVVVDHPCCVTAAVTGAAGAPFSLTRLMLDAPRHDEVRVRLVATGICHTDVAMRNSPTRVPKPAVLGHEGAGVVEAVGSSVTKVVPGDHVVMSFASCGHCSSCAAGRPAYCRNLAELNFAGHRADGSSAFPDESPRVSSHFFGQSSFATYSIAYERNVVKVPKDVPLERLGPLACGVQTGAGAVLNSLKVGPGQSLAVFGVGSVGLSAVMAARLAGCTRIAAIDVNSERLELARELGASDSFNASSEDVLVEISKRFEGGLDFSIDTSGRLETIQLAVHVLGPGGVCGLVSVANGLDVPLNVGHLMRGGRSVVGIHQGDSVPDVFIPKLIDLHRRGELPFDRLLSFYPFERINDALDDMMEGRVIKPIVMMPSESP